MQDGVLLRYDSGADPGLLLLPPVRVHQGGGLADQPQGPRPLQPQARGTHICRLYQCFSDPDLIRSADLDPGRPEFAPKKGKNYEISCLKSMKSEPSFVGVSEDIQYMCNFCK